jgi:hypothetical protein
MKYKFSNVNNQFCIFVLKDGHKQVQYEVQPFVQYDRSRPNRITRGLLLLIITGLIVYSTFYFFSL